MIYLIIYLTGVLFSIALYIFVQWKTRSPLCLGQLITFTFLSAFSWITFLTAAAILGYDIVIFDFEKNDRKNKMRE
jgi:hypothetical protein